MNELRWILLVAGLLLIVGLYAWGMRSRTRAGGSRESQKRPAVFTGSADSFESPAATAGVATGAGHERRRIEPSISLDDEFEHTGGGTELDFELPDESTAPVMASRREPTWTTPAEDGPRARPPAAATGRTEPPRDRPADVQRAPARQRDEPGRDEPVAAAEPASASPARQKILAMRVNAVPPSRLDGAALKQAILAEGLEFGRYDIFHRLHDDGRAVFSLASLREPGTFDVEAMDTSAYPGVALFAVLPGPVGAADAVDDMMFTARAIAAQLGGALADDRGAPLTPLRIARMREDALEFERGGGPG